jgi:hypothetical protein
MLPSTVQQIKERYEERLHKPAKVVMALHDHGISAQVGKGAWKLSNGVLFDPRTFRAWRKDEGEETAVRLDGTVEAMASALFRLGRPKQGGIF